MEKIIEALSKLLPEDQVNEVASAIEDILKEAKAELEGEYNTKLEEAYAELSSELKGAEKTAEQGYQEAWTIIEGLRQRLTTQQAEAEAAIEEGYEEAYQMLLAERKKNEKLEADLYEEYDSKLGQMREYMIDKIDEFLQVKGKEIYEQARRDVANDPQMVEHKVTLSKIVETVADYISDEDYHVATSKKIEEMAKSNDELKGQVRLLEARAIRMSSENNKLNEQVRQQQQLISEGTEAGKAKDKKERVESARNATGRGHKAPESAQVITEQTEEQSGADFTEWQVLAGIKKD